jgi:hypothetical protein
VESGLDYKNWESLKSDLDYSLKSSIFHLFMNPIQRTVQIGKDFYFIRNQNISLEDYQEALQHHTEAAKSDDDSNSDYPSSHYWACKRYRKYIKISKVLTERGIQYISPSVGVFLITDGRGKRFYYYPNASQWRKEADGRSKPIYYKVRNIEQLLDKYLFKESV